MQLRKSILLLPLFAIIPIIFFGGTKKLQKIYGNVSVEKYVTGRFTPGKHPHFVELSSLKIPTNKYKHYLRKEAAQALRKMITALMKDHPEAKIWVKSSTRCFMFQKIIWERKWDGDTLVEGKKLNKTVKDPKKRALKILEYSSMPGTSRHHWGTEFDINKLNNNYYNSGNGALIFRWLKKNAHRFGFCQPYTAGRKQGYKEERWHWSYMPLATIFLKDWIRIFNSKKSLFKRKGDFKGSEYTAAFAPIYVRSINADCK